MSIKGASITDLITYEKSSMIDPVGRIFYYMHNVFRAIEPNYVEQSKNILQLAKAEGWFEAGLVGTSPSKISFEGFGLVLQHDRVRFNTTRAEWTGEALRAAALCTLSLLDKLIQSGWALKDGHPWNIMFEGVRPVFVDFGSIIPIENFNRVSFYQQFRNYFLVPLHLFSIGEPDIARSALREHIVGVGLKLSERMDPLFSPAEMDANGLNTSFPFRDVIRVLTYYLMQFKLPKVDGNWSIYPQQDIRTEIGDLHPKHQLVYRLLSEDKGQTMFDIGASRGLHSMMGAKLGKEVLAGDVEESVVNELYLRCATEHLSKVQPIYYNFLHPMPRSGILGKVSGAFDRLQCDTVIMLALTHHLVFAYGLDFDTIADGVRQLSKKRLIIEFVLPEDVHVQGWSPQRLPWYTLENFLQVLGKRYRNVQTVPLDPPTRLLVVCDEPA